MYYEKFKEGKIAELVASMEAMHQKKDFVSPHPLERVGADNPSVRDHSLRTLNVKSHDHSQPPLEPPHDPKRQEENDSGSEEDAGDNGEHGDGEHGDFHWGLRGS